MNGETTGDPFNGITGGQTWPAGTSAHCFTCHQDYYQYHLCPGYSSLTYCLKCNVPPNGGAGGTSYFPQVAVDYELRGKLDEILKLLTELKGQHEKIKIEWQKKSGQGHKKKKS